MGYIARGVGSGGGRFREGKKVSNLVGFSEKTSRLHRLGEKQPQGRRGGMCAKVRKKRNPKELFEKERC